MSYVIGEDVRVAAAKDSVLLGLKGRLVLESMHTLTIKTVSGRKVRLPKTGTALELAGGRVVIADDLEGRLEDRLAWGKPTRQGAGVRA